MVASLGGGSLVEAIPRKVRTPAVTLIVTMRKVSVVCVPPAVTVHIAPSANTAELPRRCAEMVHSDALDVSEKVTLIEGIGLFSMRTMTLLGDAVPGPEGVCSVAVPLMAQVPKKGPAPASTTSPGTTINGEPAPHAVALRAMPITNAAESRDHRGVFTGRDLTQGRAQKTAASAQQCATFAARIIIARTTLSTTALLSPTRSVAPMPDCTVVT